MTRRHNTKGFSNENIDRVGNVSGAYALMNSSGNVTYVGKSNDLYRRLREHKVQEDIPNVRSFMAWETGGVKKAAAKERSLYDEFLPFHNDQEP